MEAREAVLAETLAVASTEPEVAAKLKSKVDRLIREKDLEISRLEAPVRGKSEQAGGTEKSLLLS